MGKSASTSEPKTHKTEERLFGSTLKRLRESRPGDMSQTALANKLKKSPSLISLLEKDRRKPTRDLISQIARALELSPEEEQTLAEAAHFPPNRLQDAIQTVASIINEPEIPLLREQEVIYQDMLTLAQAWNDLAIGVQHLRAGELIEARNRLEPLVGRSDLTIAIRVYSALYLIDALIRLGKLKEAEQHFHDSQLDAAMRQLQQAFPLYQAGMLCAELEARQGIIALRLGRLSEAHHAFEASKDRYLHLLEGSHEGPGFDEAIFGGLGWSFKRLAQLALVTHNAPLALDHCDRAMVNFRRAKRNSTVSEMEISEGWRSVLSLKGWAYAQQDNFEKAIEYHQQALKLSGQAKDMVGTMRATLFLADDFYGRIERAIEERLETSTAPLRQIINDLISSDGANGNEVSGWLKEAEQRYYEALMLSRKLEERLFRGRCVRGRANVQRLQQQYYDAERNLVVARNIEREMEQERRLLDIRESFAELAWDRGNRAGAIEEYHHLLDDMAQLDDQLISKVPEQASPSQQQNERAELRKLLEEAARPQRERAERALRLLNWEPTMRALYDHVRGFIDREQLRPISASDKTQAWLEALEAQDAEPGGRILAQNELSMSLSATLPRGYPESGIESVERRHERMSQLIHEAQRQAGQDAYHDICWIQCITGPITDEESRERLEGARDYLANYATGYHLTAIPVRLPLAFAVKGAAIIIEIAPSWEQALQSGDYEKYSFTSDDLARDLRGFFTTLAQLQKEGMDPRLRLPIREVLEDTLNRSRYAKPRLQAAGV